MTFPSDLLDCLAQTLRYPQEDYVERARELVKRLEAGQFFEPASKVAQFVQSVEALSPTELEELFVRTFDNNAERCLEIGWHLFGENYHRGVFLVQMRGDMQRLGVKETAELPDHVTHVLLVMGRMEAREARRLAKYSLLRALDQIIAGLKKKESPFLALAEATSLLIRALAGEPVATGGGS